MLARRGVARLLAAAEPLVQQSLGGSAAGLSFLHPQQGVKVTFAPTHLDHDALRASTLVSRQFLRGSGPDGPTSSHPTPPSNATLHPSPASQMCQTMAFGYSLFFKDGFLRPDVMAKSVAALAEELPAAAARVRPPHQAPGLRRMGDTVLDLNDAGIEFVLAETQAYTIQDLGPATWTAGMAGRTLDSFGVPFYTEPFSPKAMYSGSEALLKVKHTRCRDGDIVSVVVSHILADAGRAVRLLERLGELYRAEAAGAPRGPPLRMDSALESAQGFAAAVEGAPSEWAPAEKDYGLTPRQWLAAPWRLHRHVSTPYDMHLLHLPKQAARRLKALAAGGEGDSDGQRISTMDAVQAFVATLVADLRGKPLVPTAPQELTVNLDLLHRDQPFKNPQALARHIGNAVHILHVTGVPPGTSVPPNLSAGTSSQQALSDRECSERLRAALRMNARLIRRAVTDFRSDVRNTLRALERQANLVALPEARMGAAFVVKGADMKVASTTAVTAFPFDTIDFGVGPAVYAQINYQPRFDWWNIIQAAQGLGGGGGVLCSMTLESGLQQALIDHPAWHTLVPEAHLIVAGSAAEGN